MREHDYRASAPVFEVDLRAVFAGDRVHAAAGGRLVRRLSVLLLVCELRAGIRPFGFSLARRHGHDEFSGVKPCEVKQCVRGIEWRKTRPLTEDDEAKPAWHD